ncbi:LuxR C-terminal-related transcriptional regulator [Novosphingobium sp. ST904]|uniref:helix-turn-helix transcriptional regulator n=1 Tax=Novosphingobium sp. ST904 TaxID=1684385 RepID=UPI00104FE3C7|nr:LuxR C-terminal-related transcriptional regulator [Novosphingobium sp. ST904]TCM38806.1 transcriptional regulator /LuxR family transcriptional regulator [Novosphingobium sp. ST904]
MHELIRTKVAPPIWLGSQIRRDILLERLDGALSRRLTVIHAPAGYGKTSLLSQWRSRHEHGAIVTAWLTLEREDSDLQRLPRYILLALDEAAGQSAGEDGENTAADLPPRSALSAIVNRIAREPRPVVLIFDDFHRAEGSEVNAFLQSLIRLAPGNCHFVIASRDYPWLGQSMLAAEEQLIELTSDDLKFNRSEAEALLDRADVPPLPDDVLQRLVERSEGWPIALQLTSLSLKRGIDHIKLMERFSGSSSDLARYLSEQVLTSLPPETQDLVIRTALLDRLTGEAVNALCDRTDGWLVLERLEQQGVFLAPASEARESYRYHQLFAEYLRDRLARQDLARFRLLHGRAARHFADSGAISAAVEHALLAEDRELVGTILEESGGWRLIPQGHQAMIETALGRISPHQISASARLGLAAIYLQIKHGELAAAREAYDRLAAEAMDGEVPADLRTELRVVGDTLADYENLPVTLDDLLAREALLRTLPADDHFVLANFTETLAAKYLEGGWLERALEPVLNARGHYQALGSPYSEVFTHFLEARIRHAQGRINDAAAIIASARTLIEAHFGPRSDLAANCAAFEAEILYEQNRIEDAGALLAWALPHMEQSDGWVDVYAAAYLTAARCAAARHAPEEAFAILERAQAVAAARRFRQLALLAALCRLEITIAAQGPLETAIDAAGAIGLDGLADQMALESPHYRPVATAAAKCRAALRLAAGDHAGALADIAVLRRWAERHGAGRALVDILILQSHALREAGEESDSRAAFDEAVGNAMFQSLVRPFVDWRGFVQGALDHAGGGAGEGNRYRAQFLGGLARALSCQAQPPDDGVLNEAEAEILLHLSHGYSNKEIARLIGMSPDTVKYRLKSIFRKIGVDKRRDAVRVSHERGLLPGGSAPAEEADLLPPTGA